ncbi:hypothetical protein ACLOJK_023148 [Asimina triloba]
MERLDLGRLLWWRRRRPAGSGGLLGSGGRGDELLQASDGWIAMGKVEADDHGDGFRLRTARDRAAGIVGKMMVMEAVVHLLPSVAGAWRTAGASLPSPWKREAMTDEEDRGI